MSKMGKSSSRQEKGCLVQPRRSTRDKIAASCAAAGLAFVLEAGPGCESDAYAILPPQEAGWDLGADVEVFYILPPQDAGADLKADAEIYAILPPQQDSGAPVVDLAAVDSAVYYILPPDDAQSPHPTDAGTGKPDTPIFYVLPPPAKDSGSAEKDATIFYILPP